MLPQNVTCFEFGWGKRWGKTCDIIYVIRHDLGSNGAVAQLVERFDGIEEVRSSSLLSSTKLIIFF